MHACKDRTHRPQWVVVQRNFNRSAFNGYRVTPSAYSLIRCTTVDCRKVWRTKAAFVNALPDACALRYRRTPGAVSADSHTAGRA
ncbi:hypothetical protein ACFQ3Z_16265 [Streptomyces nogalater]